MLIFLGHSDNNQKSFDDEKCLMLNKKRLAKEKEDKKKADIKNLLEGKNKQRPAKKSRTGGATSILTATATGYTGGATSTSSPVRPRGLEFLQTLRIPVTPIKPPTTDTPTPRTYNQLGGLPNYETGRELARIYKKGGGAMLKAQEAQLVQHVKEMSKTGGNATASETTNVVTLEDTEDSDEPDSTRTDGARGRELDFEKPWEEASRVAGPSGMNRSKTKPGPASKTKITKSKAVAQRTGTLRPTITPTSTPSSSSTPSKRSTPKRKNEADSADMNSSNLKQRKSGSNSDRREPV